MPELKLSLRFDHSPQSMLRRCYARLQMPASFRVSTILGQLVHLLHRTRNCGGLSIPRPPPRLPTVSMWHFQPLEPAHSRLAPKEITCCFPLKQKLDAQLALKCDRVSSFVHVPAESERFQVSLIRIRLPGKMSAFPLPSTIGAREPATAGQIPPTQRPSGHPKLPVASSGLLVPGVLLAFCTDNKPRYDTSRMALNLALWNVLSYLGRGRRQEVRSNERHSDSSAKGQWSPWILPIVGCLEGYHFSHPPLPAGSLKRWRGLQTSSTR